jgi:hypothetical protein
MFGIHARETASTSSADPGGTGNLAGFRVSRDRNAPAGVAQQAEHPPCKRQVSGSIPLTGSRSRSEALWDGSFSSQGAKRGANELVTHQNAETILRGYARHFNTHRPHQGRGQLAPLDDPNVIPLPAVRIERRQAIAGLINEYRGAS